MQNLHKIISRSRHLDKVQMSIARRTNGNRSFLEKNYWLHLLLKILSVPVILYSLGTGGIFLYSYFEPSFAQPVLAGIVSGLIVLTVEAIFYWCLYAAIGDLINGDWKEGLHYSQAFSLKAVFALLAGFCSVFWSIKGSPDIADFLTRRTSPIELVDLTTIHSRYDDQLSEQKKVQDQAASMTWRGKIVSDGRQLLQQAEAQKAQIEQLRATEINEAMQENDRRRELYESRITQRGNWFLSFAGGGQVLGLLIVVFIRVFEYGVFSELPDEPEADGDEEERLQQERYGALAPGGRHAHVSARPSMQIRMPWLDKDQVETPRAQAQTQVAAKVVKPMSGQGRSSSDKLKDKLPDQVGGQVVLIGQELVFEHMGEDGQVTHYDLKSVRGFYKKYARRVRETEDKLAAAQRNNDQRLITIHSKALNNRQRWQEYWQTALELLEN